jgi:hypothetical protein
VWPETGALRDFNQVNVGWGAEKDGRPSNAKWHFHARRVSAVHRIIRTSTEIATVQANRSRG